MNSVAAAAVAALGQLLGELAGWAVRLAVVAAVDCLLSGAMRDLAVAAAAALPGEQEDLDLAVEVAGRCQR
jgi:hypothetical protein